VAATVGLERRHWHASSLWTLQRLCFGQMLRRIIPTAERTVTRGSDKTIDKGDAIRERPRWQEFL